MNLAEIPLPPYFLAVLTYHPEIGTFRGERGAWRVKHCIEWGYRETPRVRFIQDDEDGPEVAALYMNAPRPLKPNTFVNPTKLLREVLEQRRIQPHIEHQFA